MDESNPLGTPQKPPSFADPAGNEGANPPNDTPGKSAVSTGGEANPPKTRDAIWFSKEPDGGRGNDSPARNATATPEVKPDRPESESLPNRDVGSPPRQDTRRTAGASAASGSRFSYRRDAGDNPSGGLDGAEANANQGGYQFRDYSRWSEESAENEFRVGAVLGLTFSSLWKNPLLYFSLALIACLPGILVEWGYWIHPRKDLIKQLLDLFLSVIFMGAIAYGVHRDMVGGRAGLGEAIVRGLSSYFSLIGISLLTLLFFFGLGLTAVVAIVLPTILVVLFILIVLSYVICVFAVSGPACVVERLGPVASLDRSAKLTKYHRWGIFGLFFIWGIGVLALTFAAKFIFPGFSGGLRFRPGPDFTMFVITPITTAFYQVMLAVTYYRLRVAKEGLGVDKLATVFD